MRTDSVENRCACRRSDERGVAIDAARIFASPALPSEAKLLIWIIANHASPGGSGVAIDAVPGLCGLPPSRVLPLVSRLVECGALQYARRTRRHNHIAAIEAVRPGPALRRVAELERYFERLAEPDDRLPIMLTAEPGAAQRNRPAIDYCRGERATFGADGGAAGDGED